MMAAWSLDLVLLGEVGPRGKKRGHLGKWGP